MKDKRLVLSFVLNLLILMFLCLVQLSWACVWTFDILYWSESLMNLGLVVIQVAPLKCVIQLLVLITGKCCI